MLIEEWRQDYNARRPHSELQMTDTGRVRGQRPSTALAIDGNDVWGRGRAAGPLFVASGAPQPAVFPAQQRQSPAEEITPSKQHTDRQVAYRGSTIPSTELSQQVDR